MNYKRIYMIGIGGIGMSALAQYLIDHGTPVSGSDREISIVTEVLRSKGIEVIIGQGAANVPADADLIVYSDAVWEDNPERIRAKELGVRQISYFEMLGQISKEYKVVAVAGTHGKTTVTGMLARILRDAGASPTAIVGSLVRDFGSNYLRGNSDLFVVEACEYRRHFLELSPTVLVVTNIEWDHTDYFKDLKDFQSAFRSLMEKVPAHGAIVTDTMHPNIAPLLSGLSAHIVDYKGEHSREVSLPGEFNVANGRAAASAARFILGPVSEETLENSLFAFQGTWRRFEYKGKTKAGIDVYDDYAHHPTAIEKTLKALRQRTKGRIIVAFHPHLYSRTCDLLYGFSKAFHDADEVVIAPIYAAREIDDGTISNKILAEKIANTGVHAIALNSFDEIAEFFESNARTDDVIMTMGAGDIYKVAEKIIV